MTSTDRAGRPGCPSRCGITAREGSRDRAGVPEGGSARTGNVDPCLMIVCRRNRIEFGS